MLLRQDIRQVSELLQDHPDFMMIDGIPRQKTVYSDTQSQTSEAFAFKWQHRHTYESESMQNFGRNWYRQRYGLTPENIPAFLRGKRILDAGCGAGNGAVMLFGETLNEADFVGIDISNAVEVAATRFREFNIRGQFVQCSFTEIPDTLGKFDIIFSDGALHHSDDTRYAIHHLAKRLNPGGVFMFYVYKKKGPLREFADDYIREKLAPLSNQEAWDKLRPLTKFGKTLGELNIDVTIDEPIELLDIPAGTYNLQRLFYYHIFKIFYREEFDLEEMNHINFDWYRPVNCHRHKSEELIEWVTETGAAIERMQIEDSGITVVARLSE